MLEKTQNWAIDKGYVYCCEAETVSQKAGAIPKICAVFEDHWAGHNSMVVEVEGEIVEQIVLISPWTC